MKNHENFKVGRVMVVDDEAELMTALCEALAGQGYETIGFTTGADALKVLVDQDYDLLRKHLTNPDLPGDVLEVLLGDVLNRPNSLKLPALLEVARSPQHPKAAEAKDFLELFLESDYGTDWDKWQAGMEQWLKDNPD